MNAPPRAALSITLAVSLTGLAVSCARSGNATSSNATSTAAAAPAQPTIPLPSPTDPKPSDYPGIHNAVAYHEGFISGSAPDGDVGFDTLAGMGVKTIISVDGAAPDVDKASARGMRYIHLPIGYNGFDEQRRLELVRATRDAMNDGGGTVYIHCHHGKHRSAGAAAAIAASLGWETPAAAVERMKVSGTSPEYKGLYACAAESAVLGSSVVDAVPAKFPSVAPPQGFVKSMVEIDEVFDRLKAIEKAGWKTPANHPDLVPVAEAGRLADLFRLLADGDRARRKPVEFADMLRSGSQRAQSIEDLLTSDPPDVAKLSARFKELGASCTSCHASYRDVTTPGSQ